ncbi:MAG: L-threonylcarbamoyladenylate synthase [Oscillospiraceae bacterium]|nr:L-threonylcarbamoyladenylate synthase [Oscillospiraceae bacterium]MCL2227906.1 L-threonylcarbamoyladenylate synthase [Oscillospiraceae bacterium]
MAVKGDLRITVNTIILDAGKKENIMLCAEAIKSGNLVAIPTETVYGLGANALNEKAVSAIFATKGRQADNPLIVHVASPSDAKPLVSSVPPCFDMIVDMFWPGPLTLVMKKSAIIPSIVSAGLDTVAIRVPNHPAALALIRSSGCPIAAPSANLSGSPSPTKAVHVNNDIGGKIKYILDGGDCKVGVESTVLDISDGTLRILRPGGVTLGEIKKLLQTVELDDGTSSSVRSPGMKYRHYATKAPIKALLGSPSETAEYIKRNINGNTAALMFDDFSFNHPNIVTFGASEDHVAQASKLFDALRELDSMDVSAIFAQIPKEDGLGMAVANRIRKAASGKIISLVFCPGTG